LPAVPPIIIFVAYHKNFLLLQLITYKIQRIDSDIIFASEYYHIVASLKKA